MRLAGGLLSIVTTVGCAGAPTDSGVANLALPRAVQLAGCYQVERGPWAETGQHPGLVPPAEFRLDTAVSTWRFANAELREAGAEPVRHVETTVGQLRPSPGTWFLVGQDSVRINWNNGFSTGGYRLVVRGDSVVGIATTHSDFRIATPSGETFRDPTAAVRGMRVPCGR